MKHIFEPVQLGNLSLKNRLIRSATMETFAVVDGKATSELKQVYGNLASGGAGLIITGMMGIGPNSRVSAEMVGTELEGFSKNFRELADTVHACGSKLIAQLSHCGFKVTQFDTIDTPRSPSPTATPSGGTSVEMTAEEIKQVVADFAAAAKRCKEAGADGVQIHSAHAYLLSQFLSPYFNQRTDEYGGSIENRARIVFEVYDAVRQAVGDTYPVLIKINYQDLLENGLVGTECEYVCKVLEEKKIDAIEVSSGVNVDRASASSPRIVDGKLQNFAEAGKKIASLVNVPVISVGGHREFDSLEQLLNESNIAAFSMSRPFLREPDLPAKWESGNHEPAKCISCNKCFRGLYFCRQMEHQE